MVATIRIDSSHDDTILSFVGLTRNKDGSLQDYEVHVSKTGIDCGIDVCGYLSDGFGDFLSSLDDDMQSNGGWEGTKGWSSLEGELELSAESDSLGHTTLVATLKSGHYDLDWELKIGLTLDAIQLQSTARTALAALQFPPNV